MFQFLVTNWTVFPQHLHYFTFPLATYEGSNFTTSSPALILRFYHYYGHPSCHIVLCNLRFYFFCHTARQAYEISVPQPGIKPIPPALEAGNLNHWTAREVPNPAFILVNHQDLKWQAATCFLVWCLIKCFQSFPKKWQMVARLVLLGISLLVRKWIFFSSV